MVTLWTLVKPLGSSQLNLLVNRELSSPCGHSTQVVSSRVKLLVKIKHRLLEPLSLARSSKCGHSEPVTEKMCTPLSLQQMLIIKLP